jgi:hypothetical protein
MPYNTLLETPVDFGDQLQCNLQKDTFFWYQDVVDDMFSGKTSRCPFFLSTCGLLYDIPCFQHNELPTLRKVAEFVKTSKVPCKRLLQGGITTQL